MSSRFPWRRIAGIVGVLAVALALVLGVYGLTVGYLFDPSTAAPIAPTVLTAVVVGVFVASVSILGSRGGGWIDTPYW